MDYKSTVQIENYSMESIKKMRFKKKTKKKRGYKINVVGLMIKINLDKRESRWFDDKRY